MWFLYGTPWSYLLQLNLCALNAVCTLLNVTVQNVHVKCSILKHVLSFFIAIFKIHWKKTLFTPFWMFDSCLVCDWTSNGLFFTCLPHTFITCFQLNWASESYCSWRNFPLWQLLEMLADNYSASYMRHLFENWAYTIGYVQRRWPYGAVLTL